MARYDKILVGALACAVVGASPALADHIDGHHDNDPVHPVPIPGEDWFTGGALFVTAIGPVGGREIVNTRLDITYVSDGATPASDMRIAIGLAIEDEFGDPIYREIAFTGAELGFGSGPGTFHGTLESDFFNGVAHEGFFPPYSIVDIAIDATTGGIEGYAYFVDSYIYYDLVPVPAPATLAGLGLGSLVLRRRR